MENWKHYIVSDPKICHGQACIKGTRILVSTVLDNLSQGVAMNDLLLSYPSLSIAAVHASLEYAAAFGKT